MMGTRHELRNLAHELSDLAHELSKWVVTATAEPVYQSGPRGFVGGKPSCVRQGGARSVMSLWL